MNFIASVLLLAALAVGVTAPMLVGHALSEREAAPAVLGVVCIVIAAGLFFVHMLLVRRAPARDPHAPPPAP